MLAISCVTLPILNVNFLLLLEESSNKGENMAQKFSAKRNVYMDITETETETNTAGGGTEGGNTVPTPGSHGIVYTDVQGHRFPHHEVAGPEVGGYLAQTMGSEHTTVSTQRGPKLGRCWPGIQAAPA